MLILTRRSRCQSSQACSRHRRRLHTHHHYLHRRIRRRCHLLRTHRHRLCLDKTIDSTAHDILLAHQQTEHRTQTTLDTDACVCYTREREAYIYSRLRDTHSTYISVQQRDRPGGPCCLSTERLRPPRGRRQGEPCRSSFYLSRSPLLLYVSDRKRLAITGREREEHRQMLKRVCTGTLDLRGLYRGAGWRRATATAPAFEPWCRRALHGPCGPGTLPRLCRVVGCH